MTTDTPDWMKKNFTFKSSAVIFFSSTVWVLVSATWTKSFTTLILKHEKKNVLRRKLRHKIITNNIKQHTWESSVYFVLLAVIITPKRVRVSDRNKLFIYLERKFLKQTVLKRVFNRFDHLYNFLKEVKLLMMLKWLFTKTVTADFLNMSTLFQFYSERLDWNWSILTQFWLYSLYFPTFQLNCQYFNFVLNVLTLFSTRLKRELKDELPPRFL